MKNTAGKTKILIIGGPTATGKSALAVKLARRFGGEVINADAYQIYRGMDIGTAKVTPAEQQGVPHHLLDIVAPGTPFSVAQFKRLAQQTIAAVQARGHLPILVGGTGFYLNAVRLDLPLGGAAPASPYRQTLQRRLAASGPAAWQQLQTLDPVAAAQIPVTNSRRVIRALEVIHTTGRAFSAQPPPRPAYDDLVIGLTTERARLYARINQRVDAMLAAGLVAEVQRVLQQAGPDAQALKAIGYKELVPYLTGQGELAAAVAAIEQNSRRYAKRQLTYFRHQLPTHWFDLVADAGALAQVTALVAAWQNEGDKTNELAR